MRLVPLTSDERERFLSSLRTDPAFRDEVRREVLSAELMALPERFAAFVEEMRAFVEEMRSFVEATDRRFDALERDAGRLQDDSGQLRGMILEQKVRMNPGYYLRNQARRVRVVDLDDLLDDLGISDMNDEGYVTLARTDVLAQGVSRTSGARVVFLVETTWRVHRGDVDRQVVRRQVLADRGVDAVAVIASTESPGEDIRRYGERNGIILEHAKVADAA